MDKVYREASGPRVSATYDRMAEIAGLIRTSHQTDPQVEYSALLGAAASVLAASMGIVPSQQNLQVILHIVANEMIPAIDDAVKKRFPNN